MFELLTAVAFASLVGSVHCVGMCGPFVALAIGSPPNSTTVSGSVATGDHGRYWNLTAYHLGRLTTYGLLGLAMGTVGLAANGISGWLGVSNSAATIVGATMVGLGMWRLVEQTLQPKTTVSHSEWFASWTRGLVAVKKRLRFQSRSASAYAWGLISTWLPCGWLYVFALASAGTGGPRNAALLMFAFWIGTLPLLSLVGVSIVSLGSRAQRFVQPFAACLMIAFGLLTATSRAQIDLGPLTRSALASQSSPNEKDPESVAGKLQTMNAAKLNKLVREPLPCCSDDGS